MNEEHILRQKVQEDINAVSILVVELRKKIKEARKEYEKNKHDILLEIGKLNREARRKQKAIDIYFGDYVSPASKYHRKKRKAEEAVIAKGDQQ